MNLKTPGRNSCHLSKIIFIVFDLRLADIEVFVALITTTEGTDFTRYQDFTGKLPFTAADGKEYLPWDTTIEIKLGYAASRQKLDPVLLNEKIKTIIKLLIHS